MANASEQVLAAIGRTNDLLETLIALQRGGGASATVDAADLDGKYGDPTLRFKPRDWSGDDFKGCNFSQCPPELLDQVSESLEYFARRAEENNELTTSGKPKAPFNRKDAARARGWAARIRSGWKPAGIPEAAGGDEFAAAAATTWGTVEPMLDDIPFAWILPFVLPMTAATAALLSWV